MERTIKVECQHCKKKGILVVQLVDGEWDVVKDYIKHKRGCELRPEQPKHFKNRRKWQRGEKRGNDLVGAKETIVSGALNQDGDGRILNQWRVETKTTSKETYRLYERLWNKLHDGALSNCEEPIFYIETVNARFVLVRKALGILADLKDVQVSGKSFVVDINLAIELNNKNGHVLTNWIGEPVVMLSRNFNHEGQYEEPNN